MSEGRNSLKRGSAMHRDIMTPAQVADHLQVHKLTVYRYIREGELPAVRLGRALRILKIDVDEFLRAHQVADAQKRDALRRIHSPAAAQSVVRVLSEDRRNDQAEISVVSRTEHRPSREDLLANNPLDWVARGLH